MAIPGRMRASSPKNDLHEGWGLAFATVVRATGSARRVHTGKEKSAPVVEAGYRLGRLCRAQGSGDGECATVRALYKVWNFGDCDADHKYSGPAKPRTTRQIARAAAGAAPRWGRCRPPRCDV